MVEKHYITEAKKYFKKKYGKDMTPTYLKYAPAKEVSDYTNVRKKMKQNQENSVKLGTKRYGATGYVSRAEKKSRADRVKKMSESY